MTSFRERDHAPFSQSRALQEVRSLPVRDSSGAHGAATLDCLGAEHPVHFAD